MPKPFLYDLFTAARQRLGLPIGMEEYFLLLRALRLGKGIADREALRQLCETLWIKNERQRRAFRHLYEEQIADDLRAATAILEALEATPEPSPEIPEEDQEAQGETEQKEKEDTEAPTPQAPKTPEETDSTSQITLTLLLLSSSPCSKTMLSNGPRTTGQSRPTPS